MLRRRRYGVKKPKQKDKTTLRRYALKMKYNLTLEEYDTILHRQGGCCAICKRVAQKWDVDHDHQSKVVRGVLCHPCNLMLGLARDNMETLIRAAFYLEDGSPQKVPDSMNRHTYGYRVEDYVSCAEGERRDAKGISATKQIFGHVDQKAKKEAIRKAMWPDLYEGV